MEDFGHIKAAKGHTETHFEYERCSRRESGRGGEGGGRAARQPWCKWEDQSRGWWQSAVPCCAAQIKTG